MIIIFKYCLIYLQIDKAKIKDDNVKFVSESRKNKLVSLANNDIKQADNVNFGINSNTNVEYDDLIELYFRVPDAVAITVGVYEKPENHPLGDMESTLYSEVFQTLKPKQWIDGSLIDAFIIARENIWLNTIVFPTWETSSIFGDNEIPLLRYWKQYIENLKNFKELILFTYKNSGHWCIFAVKIEKKTAFHLDSFTKEENHRTRVAKKIF